MIFVGGGANEAVAEVRALAERLTAPVVAYRRGKGVLDERHPLSHVLRRAGTALGARPTWCSRSARACSCRSSTWGVDDKLKIIKVDIDPAEMERLRKPEIGLVGDAAARAQRASRAISRKLSPMRADRVEASRALKE